MRISYLSTDFPGFDDVHVNVICSRNTFRTGIFHHQLIYTWEDTLLGTADMVVISP